PWCSHRRMTLTERSPMATADECRSALESLTARLSQLDAKDREAHLADRTLSCRVPDLGLTFLTRLSPEGAGDITEAVDGGPRAAGPAHSPGSPPGATMWSPSPPTPAPSPAPG